MAIRKGLPKNSRAAEPGHVVVVLAAYLAGAEKSAVDTEDIAVKADELAPGRFSWRKYKNQINLDAVRVALSDAKKAKNGALIAGSGAQGWTLTTNGVAVAKKNARDRASDPSQRKRPAATRTWLQAEKRRLLGSEASEVASSQGIKAVTQGQAEEFFRVDDYIVGRNRLEKVQRLIHFFGDDPELGPLVAALAKRVRR